MNFVLAEKHSPSIRLLSPIQYLHTHYQYHKPDEKAHVSRYLEYHFNASLGKRSYHQLGIEESSNLS